MNLKTRFILALMLTLGVLGAYRGIVFSESSPAPDPLLVQGAASLNLPIERVSVTRWRPDTCDCDVYYAWDRTSSEDSRVHVAIRAQACRFHKAATPGASFDSVLAENRHKKRCRGESCTGFEYEAGGSGLEARRRAQAEPRSPAGSDSGSLFS